MCYNFNMKKGFDMKMKEKIISIVKAIGLFLLFFMLSTILVIVFNIDINSLSDLEYVIFTLVCDVIFLTVIALCYNKTLKKDFKPFFKDFGKNFEEAFKYYLVGVGVMIFSNLIITLVFSGGLSSNESTVRSYIETAPLLMFLEISLYAPLAEELLFRKSIRECISNKWLYVFVSGFIFGALHVVGTEGLIGLLYLIPYCSLGFAFAYTYVKTDNIYSSISMHFMHNTLTLVLLLVGASL